MANHDINDKAPVRFYLAHELGRPGKTLQNSISEIDKKNIIRQLDKAGFKPTRFPNDDFFGIRVVCLGYDTEDSFSLIVEAEHKGRLCWTAVGYGMNRHNLAIRQSWFRREPEI